MRKFICIIALLCSIFVSQAQLIIPVGKTLTTDKLNVKTYDPVTDEIKGDQTMDFVCDFKFISKDSLTVTMHGKVQMTVKVLRNGPPCTDPNLELYYFEVAQTYNGKTDEVLMGVLVDPLGKIKSIALGTNTKLRFFYFDYLQTIKS